MVISLVALVIGFIIDLIVGDPHFLPHPIRFIGNLILISEKFLRKIFPKTKKGEIVAGVFLVVIVTVISTLIPLGIIILAGQINIYLRLAIESIMCWQILATKNLKTESMKVYYALNENDIEKARFNVSMIVARDTAVLDDKGITKAAVETVAENTSDGIIAPMLFTAIGGPCLGFFYKAINTMDSMVGYKNDKYINVGKTAAKLDDIVNFIPARLSAAFMIIASFILRYDYKNASKIYKRDKNNHASPNSAHTEACCAGALNIRLAGDAVYHGKLLKKPYIGDDNREIIYEDIKRANKILYMTAFIAIFIFVAIMGGVTLCL